MVYAYIKSKDLVGYFKSYTIVSKLARGFGYDKFDEVVTDFKRLDYNYITMCAECNRLVSYIEKDSIIFVAELSQLCNCPLEQIATLEQIKYVGARIISPFFDSDNFKTEESFKMFSVIALLGENDSPFNENDFVKLNSRDICYSADDFLKAKGRYDLSEFSGEIKSVEYPEKILEIAADYMSGESISFLIRKHGLKPMCVPTLKRLCEEFTSETFKGLQVGSAEYKNAMRDVISDLS